MNMMVLKNKLKSRKLFLHMYVKFLVYRYGYRNLCTYIKTRLRGCSTNLDETYMSSLMTYNVGAFF